MLASSLSLTMSLLIVSDALQGVLTGAASFALLLSSGNGSVAQTYERSTVP